MFKWILSAAAAMALSLAVATHEVQASPQYVVAPQYSGYYYAPAYPYYYNPGYVYYPRVAYYPNYYYAPNVYPYRTQFYGNYYYRPWFGWTRWR